jgi:hypothetical protein
MLQVCWRSTTFPNCIWSWVKTTSSAVDANTLFKSQGSITQVVEQLVSPISGRLIVLNMMQVLLVMKYIVR